MYHHLKKIRIALSVISILSITLLFVDINQFIPNEAYTSIIFLQFMPSLMKFISTVSLAAIGVFIIIFLTVLFGRIYCSAICPLGILIDIILFFKKKTLKWRKKKKARYEYEKPLNKTRFTILGITILSMFSGSMILVNILDPFSNFGRIVNTSVRPVVIGLNNVAAFTLEKFDNYLLAPFSLKSLPFIIILFSILFFVFVAVLSVKKGRLYCNTVCPVGAFLGIISKFSVFKIKVNEPNCVSCGACERACKANCIDFKSKEIDFTRCVVCFDCFESCPTQGLKFEPISFELVKPIMKPVLQPQKVKVQSESRRKMLSLGVMMAGIPALKSIAQVKKKPIIKVKNKIPVVKQSPTTPPGSMSIQNFTSSCTSCYLCVSACPSQVLQPSLFQYGSDGILMPHMNYENAYCNYNCVKCTEVCPSGAIGPIKIDEKKTIQLGKVKFIKENCIVITNKTECGACSEHCPTKAVTMVEENGLRVPVTREEICVGCGACEYACPAIPNKAIYVEGNVVHAVAQLPKEKALEAVDVEEEFPF